MTKYGPDPLPAGKKHEPEAAKHEPAQHGAAHPHATMHKLHRELDEFDRQVDRDAKVALRHLRAGLGHVAHELDALHRKHAAPANQSGMAPIQEPEHPSPSPAALPTAPPPPVPTE